MKRVVAIFLLLGYLTLTPFCFLAGALHENSTLSSHSMPGMEMDMPMHGTKSPIETTGDHLGMYISQTGAIEQSEQLLVLSLLYITLILFVLVTIAPEFLVALPSTSRYRCRNDIIIFIANIGVTNWLTLSKISPPRISIA